MRALQFHGVWEKINIMLAKSVQMRSTFSNMADFPLPKENCIVDNTPFLTIQQSSLVFASILLHKVLAPSHLTSCASMSTKSYALHLGSPETTPRYRSTLPSTGSTNWGIHTQTSVKGCISMTMNVLMSLKPE